MTITEYPNKTVITANENNPNRSTVVETIYSEDYGAWGTTYKSAVDSAIARAYEAEK